MFVILLVYLFVCCYGVTFGNHSDFLSKEKTTSVKGIFIVLVFFRHFNSYVTYNHVLDNIYVRFESIFGQAIVTMFLFYSGYGIMYSSKRKGEYMSIKYHLKEYCLHL